MASLFAAWFAGNRCRWGTWLLLGGLSSSCRSSEALFRFAPLLGRSTVAAPPAYFPPKQAARLPSVQGGPVRSGIFFRRAPNNLPTMHAVAHRQASRRPARAAEPTCYQPLRPPPKTTANRLHTTLLSSLAHSDTTVSPPPAAGAGTPGFLQAAGLLALGGVLIAGAGLVLGIGVGGGWGLLLGLGGLVVGLLCGMASVFGATVRENYAKPRFNAVTLLGLLLPLGGVALGWWVGGLVGIGLGLLLLGFGAVLAGLGRALGMPD